MNISQLNILTQIRQALADGANAISHDRFFKEGEAAKVYGIQSTEVHKIAKAGLLQIKEYPKQTIFELCDELWQSGYMEEIRIACVWTEALHKQYEPADFAVFERWVSNCVNNWADCDTLCNHTVGEFIMMYPDYIAKLKEWAKSPNRWLRRAAAVTLIIPARKGLFLNDILEIAAILLRDKDDLVQKGYGWMLKAASMSETFVKGDDQTKREHLNTVFQFVVRNKSVMPRTALRYAIEKMPSELKTKAMEK
jgi:3-methyladenine DNA glycosylase AlkD